MKPNIKILGRIFLGRDTEVILVQHERGFEIGIDIQKLQRPHCCNQLYKNFTDGEKARVLFSEVKGMREQYEVVEARMSYQKRTVYLNREVISAGLK